MTGDAVFHREDTGQWQKFYFSPVFFLLVVENSLGSREAFCLIGVA
jgi:hypothetical protein